MPETVPERLRWAVEMLALNPTDQVLEIGCGHGVAVALICAQLTTGTMTAIDRSGNMVAVARKRNHAGITSGKARIQPGALGSADVGDQRFDKIVAVNVNHFWTHPGSDLDWLRERLTPTGQLYLVYQPPTADKAREIADQITPTLAARGFTTRVQFADLVGGTGVCIIATRYNNILPILIDSASFAQLESMYNIDGLIIMGDVAQTLFKGTVPKGEET